MAQVIINELNALKKEYGRKRRTVIENGQEAVYKEKEIEEMEVMFLMDRFGYAKTIDMITYERNKEAADSENRYVFPCKNTGRICLFTDTGQLYTIKVMDLPFGKFRDKGIPIDNVSNFSSEKEELLLIASQDMLNLCQVLFVTAQSMVKVVDGSEFDVAKRTVAATKLNDQDRVVSVAVLKEQRNVVLQTKDGYFLRFPIEEIPEKKKGAIGVRGMKLGEKDFETDSEAVFLNERGRRTVLTSWQKRKAETIEHPFLQEKIPIGMIPYAQAMLFARVLRGDLDRYPPFIWR